MTQEQFEIKQKELFQIKKGQINEAIAEYEEKVRAAAELLREQKEGAKRSYAFFRFATWNGGARKPRGVRSQRFAQLHAQNEESRKRVRMGCERILPG